MIPSEFRRIFKELLEHKKALVIIGTTGVIMAAADTKFAMLLAGISDSLKEGNTDAVKNYFWIVIGLSLVKNICRFFHLFNMNYVGELVGQGLRQKLQKKFMHLTLSFHNNYASGSGGLISRILNDIVIIQHGQRMFADFFREPVLMVGLIGWLFYLDWKLTSTIIIVLPMVLLFLKLISKGIKKYSIKGQEDLERITSTIKETLDGVRIIQSFNLEDEMAKRFENDSKEFLSSRRRIHRLIEIAGPVNEFVMYVLILSIVLYMSLQIDGGKASMGVFISYAASLMMLGVPVKKLQESYVRIQETGVAARRVFSLLDDEREVIQTKEPNKFPTTWNEIRFENVTFSYGGHPILKKVNFSVKKGEIVAFVGPSGSGKSTLVNLLARFFDPTEGKISIDGLNISDMALKDLRRHIALVSQDVFLFSDTIERNIWSGDFTSKNDRVKNSAESANAHQFIMKMPKDYQYQVGDRGGLLSGGEKQRISIARAFFKNAPILILDEATSALDSASEVEVQNGIDHLMEGKTTFIIAHRLSTVSKADRILFLMDGTIVESGTHQSLLDLRGNYFKLHQLQYSNTGSAHSS